MRGQPLSRRSTLLGAAAIGISASTASEAQTSSRKTFLFIHGAYHGGWCWQLVTDILGRQGHKTYAPSLTRNADRGHLLTKEVNLDTQIADIVNLVTWEDLRNFCLVVHSFGGWPASGALEHIHDRVASLVWVDAFKPKNGDKALDDISAFSSKALEEAVARGEPGRKPPSAKTYSVNESRYAWIDSKVSPQSNGPAFQEIKLTEKMELVPKKTFVRISKYPQAALDRAFTECKANSSWQTLVQNDSGHDVMIDQPEWLTDILLQAA